ncbi:hypothetical protein ACFL2Q_03435 [Thermodesulfobacteriota bacterium]
MTTTLLLLSPRWKKFRNNLKNPGNDRLRFPFIVGLVIALWLVIFVVCIKALTYFTSEEMFGTIAATKLLSMIVITFAFVLIISNIINTFSSFFLSDDLEFLMAGPIPAHCLYRARFIETLGDSSWMVLVFGFPIFLAYGYVFAAPVTFYLLSLVGFVCLVVMITSGAVLFVQVLVRAFPVRRLRDLFILVGILIFVGVYLLFRMIRPEEFLNPEGFATVMDYVSVMSEPSSPYLPTTWLAEILKPYVTGYGFHDIWFYLTLLVTGAWGGFRLVGHYHEISHSQGYSRALESRGARLSRSRLLDLMEKVLERFLETPTVRLVKKETLLMARDWGRLSQLLLLLALIVVYLYNFSVLPSLDNPVATMFLKNSVAFLNIGLAGFVLASLGVRFLFPAISAEGRAFWILKGSPVSLRKVFWVKFVFYLVPMMILGLFLVIMTNKLLGLGAYMSIVSTLTVALITVGVTSLSLGMGVIHADLKEADPNRVFTGFGALVTMLYAGLAVATIILLEAYPVFRVLTANYFGRTLSTSHYALIGLCFAGALVTCLYLIIKPLRVGLTRIMELEI